MTDERTDEHTWVARDDHAPTYTIDQVATELHLAVGSVRRLFKAHGIHAASVRRSGKIRTNLYSEMDVQWLKQLRIDTGDDAPTNGRTPTDDGRTNIAVIAGDATVR